MSWRMVESCLLGDLDKSVINARGQIQPAITWGDKVWCHPESIRMTETYQARAVGLKPELTLVLRQEDDPDPGLLCYQTGVMEVNKRATPDCFGFFNA